MKKILLVLLIAIFSIFAFTGCSAPAYTFDSAYWQQDITAPLESINEVSVYEVKVVSQTLSNKTIVENKNVSLKINNGLYTTVLKKDKYNDKDCYSYSTTLTLSGAYEFNDTSKSFEDSFTTITYFKPFKDNFAPIKTTKHCTSNTLFINGDTVNFSYDYEVVYSGSTAKTSYIRYDKDNKVETKVNKDYKDFNKKTYIDNDLLLLMPRAINLKNSIDVSFSTIDVVRQSSVGMKYSGSNSDVKVLEGFTYFKNDAQTTVNMEVKKISMTITDKFTGTPIESYYARDTEGCKDNRQRLIKAYTPLNDNLGYLEYNLLSVNY